MNFENYLQFTDALQLGLEDKIDILALITIRNTSGNTSLKSDNNNEFFIITRPQKQEVFKKNLDWLPNHQEISFYFKDNPYMFKVFFKNGQTLKITIFDQSEIFLAQVNKYKVLFDKAHVIQDMEQVSQMTKLRAQTNQAPIEILWGRFIYSQHQALQTLLEGDILSAHHILKHKSLETLLYLLLTIESDLDLIDSTNVFAYWNKISPKWNEFIISILDTNPRQYINQLWHYLLKELIPNLPQTCQNWVQWFIQQFPDWNIE